MPQEITMENITCLSVLGALSVRGILRRCLHFVMR